MGEEFVVDTIWATGFTGWEATEGELELANVANGRVKREEEEGSGRRE